MDLSTVAEVAHPRTREEVTAWREGDAWLAGGTWLFSEPQPKVRRLIDLEGLRWEPLVVSDRGLAIAATCTIAQLHALQTPPEWTAALPSKRARGRRTSRAPCRTRSRR